jgi:cytochrome c
MKIAAIALAVAGLAATGAANAQAGMELLQKYGCTACHAVDKKVVGPAYQEVAAKYKGDAGAAVPMPPNPQVPDADLKTMTAYILSLKK